MNTTQIACPGTIPNHYRTHPARGAVGYTPGSMAIAQAIAKIRIVKKQFCNADHILLLLI
jgi:hypothetical protein